MIWRPLRARHMGLGTEEGVVGRSRSTRSSEHFATKPSELTHRSDMTASARVAAADGKRTNRNAVSFTALHPDDRADTEVGPGILHNRCRCVPTSSRGPIGCGW